MSTAPSGFTAPKTNWQPPDPVGVADFNRIEKNAAAIETGDRTLDQAQVPNSNLGSLRQILSWLANRIKVITGEVNWYDAPAVTLEQAHAHHTASAPHAGHVSYVDGLIPSTFNIGATGLPLVLSDNNDRKYLTGGLTYPDATDRELPPPPFGPGGSRVDGVTQRQVLIPQGAKRIRVNCGIAWSITAYYEQAWAWGATVTLIGTETYSGSGSGSEQSIGSTTGGDWRAVDPADWGTSKTLTIAPSVSGPTVDGRDADNTCHIMITSIDVEFLVTPA